MDLQMNSGVRGYSFANQSDDAKGGGHTAECLGECSETLIQSLIAGVELR